MPPIPADWVGKQADGRDVFRPRLTVTVSAGKKTALYRGVVDSGADNTLMPAEWVAAIGVKWDALPAGTRGFGPGGGLETRLCARSKIYYSGIVVCDGFLVAEPGNLKDLLLGRSDFFTKFVPTFHWEEMPPWFNLEPVSSKKTGAK